MKTRYLNCLLLAIVTLILGACANAPRHLPDATYADANGNVIVVDGNDADCTLYLPGIGTNETPYHSTHQYALGNNGTITFFGSSNSMAFIKMTSDYSWKWDGFQIICTHLSDGKITLLRRGMR
jgi:hypothetical protein